MDKAVYQLHSLELKAKVAEAIFAAPSNWEVELRPKKRSLEQNSLSHVWYAEIAAHYGDRTISDVKAYCKLHFGVPIMRASDEQFRQHYDKKLKHASYEIKLEFMKLISLTSLMNKVQFGEYLDAVYNHFRAEGVPMTLPEDE